MPASLSRIFAESAPDVLRAFLESADAGGLGVMVTYSEEQPVPVLVNDGLLRMLGYDRDEFWSRPALDHVAPEGRALANAMREKRRAEPDGARSFELPMLRKDGSRIQVEVTASRVTMAGRAAIVTFFYDLSGRQRAREALAASEARFRTVVESAPDGVTILRGETIVYLNPAAAEMLGLRGVEQAIGHPIADFLHEDDVPIARRRIAELVRTGQRFAEPAEYRTRRQDGREAIVELSSIPIEYEGAPAVLGFARDITERKAIQEKLVQADRLAAVGTLAAGIAHEINNPLAYVVLGLQYLERELPKLGGDPARVAEALTRLREVRSGAERVGTIVRDLKTFARADEIARGPVDVRSVIEAALRIADNEIRHRANLVREYDDVPPADGNSARLEQVFLNLLVNAAHAVSDRDPRSSEIRLVLRRGDDETVIAEVKDNGAGMSPEVLRRVFDPFYTTKPVGVGTGLGLPICRSIVETFNGRIELESEPGRGTTARVVLMVHDRTVTVPSVPAPRAPSKPPDSRGRVLVVDDEPLVASLLTRMLAPQHDVRVATSGPEALRAIEEGAFDAIVCDVMMPGMTGMDLYAALRERDRDLSNRVVFMTGGAFVPRVAEFLSQVENPKLEKPFDLDALRSALKRLLQPIAASAS
jgi:PAS domain S-box-containing protein